MATDPVPLPSTALVRASEVPALLEQIRPAWQAKNLITRVRTLITVDPSSACQRLFNAAVHDLRDKVVVAGVDIARDVARQHKLPPIDRPEDVENYSTERLIDLAYRMGLLTRPEWRRLSRCYEIRRDLEHEDDEYEAGVEDCIYIFKTCIEVVLSRDPTHLIRVQDFKELVEQPAASIPSQALLDDYRQAPAPRQEEITKFLVSLALDGTQADIVQQNAYVALGQIASLTQNPVKLAVAGAVQERIGKKAPDRRVIRVAVAAGILPYLKKATLVDCFGEVLAQMKKVGTRWRAHTEHGELLRSFGEMGGLPAVPSELRSDLLLWLVLTYLGEPGGTTSYGNIRHVFYSDTAAPLIQQLIADAGALVRSDLLSLAKDGQVAPLLGNQHIARRYERLLDQTEAAES